MSLIYLLLILLKATEHAGTRMDSERYAATPTMSEIAKSQSDYTKRLNYSFGIQNLNLSLTN